MMIRQLLAIFLCSVATIASASSIATVDTNISDPDLHDSTDSGPISAATSVTAGNAHGSASANLSTGVLRAASLGPTGPVPLGSYDTVATATIQDAITFAPGSGGTAFLDWEFDGFLTGAIGSSFGRTDAAFAYIQIIVNGAEATHTYLTNVSDFCSPNDSECVVGNAIDRIGSIPIVITPGTVSISAELQTEAENGDLSDFSNTGRLFLETPEGVSYTSDSGFFLSAATPIIQQSPGSLPEPPALTLMAMGLGLLVATSRKELKRRPSGARRWTWRGGTPGP